MNIGAFGINDWCRDDSQLFWSEIAPGEHIVQIYDNQTEFLKLLLNYTIGGIRAGECTVIIATSEHLAALNQQLLLNGFDPFYLKLKDKFMPVDAEELLSRITINDWPDEKLLHHFVTELIGPAKKHGTAIRAFGEMVALQWASGRAQAALELERLWNDFLQKENMTLFCAYPRQHLGGNESMVAHICEQHARVVSIDARRPSNDILHASTRTTDRPRL